MSNLTEKLETTFKERLEQDDALTFKILVN